jgi:pyruvate formate lyase activating enzyme
LNKSIPKLKGVVFDIKKYSLHDGPGIRTTVFLKGCPLECWWCHNPESRSTELQPILKGAHRKGYHQSFSDSHDLVGRKMSVAEIVNEVEKDLVFYDESGGGVTFSGGEPMLQIDFLDALLKECHAMDIHTAVDTAGHVPLEYFERIIDKTDLFLFDIKLIDREKHLLYTGVISDQILDNFRFLVDKQKQVIARFPIVPEITSTKENVQDILTFLKTLNNSISVSLLPFNRLGDEKYRRLDMPNNMKNHKPPSQEDMENIKFRFQEAGFHVKIGG